MFPLLAHSPRRLQAAACKADDLRSDMGIAMPDLPDPEEGLRQSKRTRLVDPEEELIGPSLAWRQSEHARLTRWVCAVYMYGLLRTCIPFVWQLGALTGEEASALEPDQVRGFTQAEQPAVGGEV